MNEYKRMTDIHVNSKIGAKYSALHANITLIIIILTHLISNRGEYKQLKTIFSVYFFCPFKNI